MMESDIFPVIQTFLRKSSLSGPPWSIDIDAGIINDVPYTLFETRRLLMASRPECLE